MTMSTIEIRKMYSGMASGGCQFQNNALQAICLTRLCIGMRPANHPLSVLLSTGLTCILNAEFLAGQTCSQVNNLIAHCTCRLPIAGQICTLTASLSHNLVTILFIWLSHRENNNLIIVTVVGMECNKFHN